MKIFRRNIVSEFFNSCFFLLLFFYAFGYCPHLWDAVNGSSILYMFLYTLMYTNALNCQLPEDILNQFMRFVRKIQGRHRRMFLLLFFFLIFS